jgi:hypothetical protein
MSDELLIKKSTLRRMDTHKSQYAVCIERTLAICIEGDEKDQYDLDPGMLIEIKEVRDRYSTVIIHDFYRKNLAFENNMYLVKTNALKIVAGDFWPFLAAVTDPFDRVWFAKNKNYMDYLMDIRLDSLIQVDGRYFNISSQKNTSYQEYRKQIIDYECIVRYIGKVDELSPGILFGLELLVIFL